MTVIDDGLATGFTARAAIEVLRRRGSHRIVLAVPVAPAGTITELRTVADEVVCLHAPSEFWAIAQFYDDFAQTSDEEVASLLATTPAVVGVGSSPADDPTRGRRGHVTGLELPGTLHVRPARAGLCCSPTAAAAAGSAPATSRWDAS